MSQSPKSTVNPAPPEPLSAFEPTLMARLATLLTDAIKKRVCASIDRAAAEAIAESLATLDCELARRGVMPGERPTRATLSQLAKRRR